MYNRNKGIRAILSPPLSPAEIKEDEAARAAVIKQVGYIPPYKPVTLPLVTDSLTKLQAAPIEVKDKDGFTPKQNQEIHNYLIRPPDPYARERREKRELLAKQNRINKQLTTLNKFGQNRFVKEQKPQIKKTNFGNVKIIPNKPKLRHELEKEIAELKNRNAVLVKHQKPLPDNVEEVKADHQGQPRGQSSGKIYSGADGAKMNEQWDRISPQDKKTLRYIEKVNYETANTSDVKPPWMTNENKLGKGLK
jgi:hypothetical protein|tara:strand:- start:1068 stop:1817 length:750 start_codon:yes stop_codon:yes gene_type:complete